MTKPKPQTPVMKQFWAAKKAHPGTLMLFRMGDFYETFDQDAITTSQTLGITLTKRANGAASTVPLAGFPYHALEQYLHKLLKAGHRVAICEQVEDPKLAKGIVKREVVEVVTPGTSLSEKFLDQRENNYLASIVFKADNFGLSILDHSTGEFLVGEWNNNLLLNMLKQFNPSEILIAESQKQLLKSHLKNSEYFITQNSDWIYDHSTAYETLTEHFRTRNLKGYGIEDLTLAISAAGANLHYVNENFKGRIEHITSVAFIQDEGVMGLDAFTIRNLEVFRSLATQGVHGTLIGIIDKTVTSMGSRLLKTWLRRPLTDKNAIDIRLKRVSEFFNDSLLNADTRQNLKEVADIDRIIARLATNRASPRDIGHLANSLGKIALFRSVFTEKEPALSELLSASIDTSKIVALIKNTLIDEPPINTNKGKYIRDGFSNELDEYRELSHNANTWLINYQAEEQQKTGIPSLKIGYNKVFGYYLEVTRTHLEKVPAQYIRKQTLANAERYFTEELKEYEGKILSAEDHIITLEAEYFQNLKTEILNYARDIQHNAMILAQLDVAAALAEIAVVNNYVCPEIHNETGLELFDSRHPVVEQLLPTGETFIPNDLMINCEDNQIGIITGPNMAGKSTYLRQIGLIVLLAQIGSFVPAQSADIGIVDKLFTRVGASDNLAGGESTFLVEMNETANILNNTTPKSLILLDEIGRGTSTYDGLSIAWSVTEYLHNKREISAKTLFATHYHELVELADQLPRAFNLNVAVKEFGSRVVFLRKIIPGGADKSYGIHVAEMAGLPKPVVQRANEVLNQLLGQENTKPTASQSVSTITQLDLFAKNDDGLRNELDELDVNNMTPLEALKKLDEIKSKYRVSG